MIRKVRRAGVLRRHGLEEGSYFDDAELGVEAQEGTSMIVRRGDVQLGNKSAVKGDESHHYRRQGFDLLTYDNFFLVLFFFEIGFLYRFPLGLSCSMRRNSFRERLLTRSPLSLRSHTPKIKFRGGNFF